MAHEIVPRSGTYISAAEVARRLATEFAHVIVDEAEGQAAALRTVGWIESANPAVFLDRYQDALRHAQRLRRLSPGEALVIRFGDEREMMISVTVLPDEPLRFGYSGPEEEKAMRDIVDRCARVLDADVVVI